MKHAGDPKLPHKIAEWAKTGGGQATVRDADAIVAWLRQQRGSEYARKPADGLRRQVVQTIERMRSTATAASSRPAAESSLREATPPQQQPVDGDAPSADGDGSWAIDATPSMSGVKRPRPSGVEPAPSKSENAIVAAVERGRDFNMLNASIRAGQASGRARNADGPALPHEAEAAEAAAPAAACAEDTAAAAQQL